MPAIIDLPWRQATRDDRATKAARSAALDALFRQRYHRVTADAIWCWSYLLVGVAVIVWLHFS